MSLFDWLIFSSGQKFGKPGDYIRGKAPSLTRKKSWPFLIAVG
jgi:hypothetical protein